MKFFTKKHKVVFRTNSGKKICKIKFTNEEFKIILLSCKLNEETLEEFFNNVIRDAARPKSTR